MVKKLREYSIDNFRSSVVALAEMASVKDGPILIRRRGYGEVVGVLITTGMYSKMEDMLHGYNIYLRGSYIPSSWIKRGCHKYLRALVGVDAMVITRHGEEIGVLLSPTMVVPFQIACPGQARRFDWSDV